MDQPLVRGLPRVITSDSLEHLGWLPRVATYSKKNYLEDEDPFFNEFTHMNPISFNQDDFRVILGSHAGVVTAISQYNVPQVTTDMLKACCLEQDYRFAIDSTRRLYSQLGRAPWRKLEECVIDPTTSAGPRFHGLKKGDVILSHLPELSREVYSYEYLAKAAPKVELQKRSKYAAILPPYNGNDIRAFIVVEVGATLRLMRICQAWNENFSSMAHSYYEWRSRVGWTASHGGWHSLMVWHSQPRWKHRMYDIKKMDKNFRECIFDIVKIVRKENMDECVHEEADVLYFNLQHTPMLLPTGEVVLKHIGNPSGQGNTTYDNTIGHDFARSLDWVRSTGVRDFNEMMEHMRDSIYSDDVVSSVSDVYANDFTKEKTTETFSIMGLPIKEEEYRESYSMLGMKFLGWTCGRKNNYYVPVADRAKVLCSLKNIPTDDPDILFSRAFNLYVHAFFVDDPVSDVDSTPTTIWLENYARQCGRRAGRILPSRSEIYEFWTGEEGAGSGAPRLDALLKTSGPESAYLTMPKNGGSKSNSPQTTTTQTTVTTTKKSKKPRSQNSASQANTRAIVRSQYQQSVDPIPRQRLSREIIDCPYALIMIAPFLEGLPMEFYKQPTDAIGSSAIYLSKQTIEITFDVSEAGVQGRFAACIQPKIGYKNTGANISRGESSLVTGATTDWSSTNDWKATTQYDKKHFVDPQFDAYISRWDRVEFNTTNPATQTNAKPYGAGVTPLDAQTTAPNLISYDASGANSVFKFPAGDWTFSGFIVTANGPAAGVTVATSGDISVNWGPFVSTSAAANQANMMWKVGFTVPDSGIGIVTLSVSAGTISVATKSSATAQMVPGPLGDNGMMEAYKVVAMAALTSFVGSFTKSGGELACYYAPHGVAQSRFMQNYSTSDGQLQDYFSLGNTRDSKRFPLRLGSYGFWSPEDAEDYMFKSPTERIDTEPPTLIVAGNYTNEDLVSTGVVRIIVWRVIEYKTSSRIPNTSKMNNELAQRALACKLVSTFPRWTENGKHEKEIMQWLKETNLGGRVGFTPGSRDRAPMNGGGVAKGFKNVLGSLIPLVELGMLFL